MVDLVPELELIIGEQPPVPELPPQEAQRRFQLVFRRFIGVFARPEHPLALFLDDLQWLDAATLDLLEDLLTRPDVRHLLLIGAYRDNEVSRRPSADAHARGDPERGGERARDRAGAARARRCRRSSSRTRFTASPSASRRSRSWCTRRPAAIRSSPSSSCLALADEGLLAFDHDAARWSWDLDRIHAKGYTDNVVDLMVGKLTRLPRRDAAGVAAARLPR